MAFGLFFVALACSVSFSTSAMISPSRTFDVPAGTDGQVDGVDTHAGEALGDRVLPGPTFTNVNDFRAVLIM